MPPTLCMTGRASCAAASRPIEIVTDRSSRNYHTGDPASVRDPALPMALMVLPTFVAVLFSLALVYAAQAQEYPPGLFERSPLVEPQGSSRTGVGYRRSHAMQNSASEAPASTIANGFTLGPNHAREAQEQAFGTRATQRKIPAARLLKAPASTIANGSTLGLNHADPVGGLGAGELAALQSRGWYNEWPLECSCSNPRHRVQRLRCEHPEMAESAVLSGVWSRKRRGWSRRRRGQPEAELRRIDRPRHRYGPRGLLSSQLGAPVRPGPPSKGTADRVAITP
jgi:hypothetical protein